MCGLLACATSAPEKLEAVYTNVVTHMPWGGLPLITVLCGVTLVVAVWVMMGQRTLANNQIKIAQMLQEHLEEHK